MGRKFKMQPTVTRARSHEVMTKREARTASRPIQSGKRKLGRGEKPRGVAGTAAARALGIQ